MNEWKRKNKTILSRQKFEGNIDEEVRRKATVMNMATMRNLVVLYDASFVK